MRVVVSIAHQPPSATTVALLALVEQARAQFEAMTPEERAEHFRAQRESFVISEATMGSDADEAAMRAAFEADDPARIAELEHAACQRAAAAAAYLKERA